MARARSKWRKSYGDYTLRSNLEKKVATYLDAQKIKYDYESEKLKYVIPASNHSYTPDFILKNGIVVEVKGRLTAADRKKMLLVREHNPDRDIRFLFAVDNKINKASKTTYSSWCEKHGFQYCVSKDGKLPTEWLTTKRLRSTRDSLTEKTANKKQRRKSK